MRKDNKARTYLQGRKLDVSKLENLGITFGYNSAQFHHRGRISEQDMKLCELSGLLIKSSNGNRTEFSYTPWASHCAIFALNDEKGNITGMYGRSTSQTSRNKHYYLKNSKGLFYYPKKGASKLIITESIIDFLSLYQIDEIRNQYDFMPIYGTNRLNGEHKTTIGKLEHLQEIIFFLDGDKAGETAVKKYAEELRLQNETIQISKVPTPEGEDINSLLQGHEIEIFTHLLQSRITLFRPTARNESFSSNEIFSIERKKAETKQDADEAKTKPEPKKGELNTTNPNNLTFEGSTAYYSIKGFKVQQLDSLKTSIQIMHPQTRDDYRTKLDLYEYKQVSGIAKQAADKLGLRSDLIEKDLSHLTNLLEDYRDMKLTEESGETQPKRERVRIPENTAKQCTAFLQKPGLIHNMNSLVHKAGVIREENNRIFLLVIASSYFMPETLHAIVQGSTSSGKTHLVRQISDFMPSEDVIRLTRVTDSSFYNYGEYQLQNKLIVIEDYDGLKEEAEYAFRELQSNGELISSTSAKDETSGSIYAKIKRVRGPICSLVATTKGAVYEDNMSRCFVLAVDESKEQDIHIVNYQNNKAAGLIDKKKEKDITRFLQNCIRLLRPYEVINPFATKLLLPEKASKIRRLNQNFQNFVKQITILNQYQRKKDKEGRLITDKEDVRAAIEIMFDSIVLKVDELDGSLRNFYENLKSHTLKKGKDYEFTRREIRQALNISKTQQHTWFKDLEELEYITQTNGYANRGFKYKISYWDNIDKLRAEIKEYLHNQLEKL
jgi:DNA primase